MHGYDLIRAERIRQVQSENYSAEDDEGNELELILAALSYLRVVSIRMDNGDEADAGLEWPWDLSYFNPGPKNKRTLVKAGALIAAAIDALPEEDA